MGVDPLLQDTPYTTRVRCLTGFAARVRNGGYGRGRKVKADSVSTAISADGQEIALACEVNPTKRIGSDKFVPRLAQALDGWCKEDWPVVKKLPVEADIPELLVQAGLASGASMKDKAIGDLTLIAFYYLLRVGEYTSKGSRNETKQTVQFKMRNVRFFRKNADGELRMLPRDAPEQEIMLADGATLQLENQKNGWKNVCIHHQWNGDEVFDAVRALGRRFCHIRAHMKGKWSTNLSAVFEEGTMMEITDNDVRRALKEAAVALQYQEKKGIPVDRIDTHSLRIGGANALSLSGYSDTEIQKMGRWRGKMFKEYVREQLSNFSEGMSRAMKKCFGFFNVEGGSFYDVTKAVVTMEYNQCVSTGASAA